MKLHHFHVSQEQTAAQRHRHAITTLVTTRRVEFIHGRTATGSEQYRLCLHEYVFAIAHIDHQNACQRITRLILDQFHRTIFFEARDTACPHLFCQTVDDFDASQIALVHGAVESLPGKSLLMQAAVRIAIKEATELVLCLLYTSPSPRDGLLSRMP